MLKDCSLSCIPSTIYFYGIEFKIYVRDIFIVIHIISAVKMYSSYIGPCLLCPQKIFVVWINDSGAKWFIFMTFSLFL